MPTKGSATSWLAYHFVLREESVLPYTIARQRGAEETVALELDATATMRLVTRWTSAYPHQYLIIKDDNGVPLAFRLPGPGVNQTTAQQQRVP